MQRVCSNPIDTPSVIPRQKFNELDFKKMPSLTPLSSPLNSSSSSHSYDYFSKGITIEHFPDELKKVMVLAKQLHTSWADADVKNQSLQAFVTYLTQENVYVCLSHAVKIRSKEQIRECFIFIERFTSLSITEERGKIMIKIKSLSTPYVTLQDSLNNLAQIYPHGCLVIFAPFDSVQRDVLDHFLEHLGKKLHGINLNSLQMNVSDEVLYKIIFNCENLKFLTIKSHTLQGYSLEFIEELKYLIFLDLSFCGKLTTLRGIEKSNILTLNLSNCHSLQSIKALPDSLKDLDISYCFNISDFSFQKPYKFAIDMSHCWRLNDSWE
jgi:hypothetical protein